MISFDKRGIDIFRSRNDIDFHVWTDEIWSHGGGIWWNSDMPRDGSLRDIQRSMQIRKLNIARKGRLNIPGKVSLISFPIKRWYDFSGDLKDPVCSVGEWTIRCGSSDVWVGFNVEAIEELNTYG